MTPRFSAADLELLQRAADWSGPKQLHELDDRTLCELSRTRGVDFATAILYNAIRFSDEHRTFVNRVDDLLQKPPATRGRLDATLVIAPGAFYREHPQTGADGSNLCRVAAQLGCRTHLLPTQSVGDAAGNGKIICAWLRGCDEPNIILCSLSKGGADVKMALALPESAAAFRNVAAWINVGGITEGSPMATWILDRPWIAHIYRALFWLRGQDFRFVRNIARRPSSPLDLEPVLPRNLKILHVAGFPLAHHLHKRPTLRWHRRLSLYGPNDGASILADCCKLPGLMLPVWGADHYLNTTHRPEALLAALLHYLDDELSLTTKRSCSVPLAGSAAN